MRKKNLFNSIKIDPNKRSVFDLSHDVKLTTNMGQLVPVMVLECLPGDTHRLGTETLLRMAPMVAPIMHRMDVVVEHFFVPNRIIWPGWAKFITGEETTSVPYLTYNRTISNTSRLFNYMGLPKFGEGNMNEFQVSALPFAAFQMIYNEYYRDQDLQPAVNFELTSGSQDANTDLIQMRKRSYEHDYLTSARPWAQKGDPVDIPLGVIPATDVHVNKTNAGVDVTGTPVGGGTGLIAIESESNPDIDPDHLYVPESSVEPTTINELRRAFALQRFLELCARAGTRLTEYLKAIWNVRSSDARLQRPEYIVGVKSPVIISEVLNQTGQVTVEGEDPGLPQGNMAGHGVTYINGNYAQYECEEHGYIIAMLSIVPAASYMNITPKHFMRKGQFDFALPQFDHIGEQEIKNYEANISHDNPNGTFGYTPRYSEYKYMPSMSLADFVGDSRGDRLSFWTLSRELPGNVALNGEFIEIYDDRRIFAVTDPDIDTIYVQALHRVSTVRALSQYSTPI